jgi:diguanylate cyclase (GGDEF)-like protein
MESPISVQRLADALFSVDPRQRIRLKQCGVASGLMLASALALNYLVWVGIAPLQPVLGWTLAALLAFGGFFAFVRSGRNLAFEDPSLTAPQMLLGFLFAVTAYMLAGRGRGAVFPILMVILMFGMYSLPPAVVRRAGLMAVAMFGVTMALMAWIDPQTYEPAVELGHFMMIAIMLPAVSMLAGQLSYLREKLRRQKAELTDALTRIQELATRDELTGLANRRHMQQLTELERARGMRSGHSFCLAVIDIDHFKRINDSHGHPVGDRVLRNFAREALATIRGADVLGRWGGEEFLLMLPNTRANLAKLGVERLRQRAEGMKVDVGGEMLSFTLSAGLVEHLAGESVADTIARADRALYLAKQQGRNRVVVA